LPNRPWTCDGPRTLPPVSEPSETSSHGYAAVPAPPPEELDDVSW
jgi:hypothetical protein